MLSPHCPVVAAVAAVHEAITAKPSRSRGGCLPGILSSVTFNLGYALHPGDALEHLDMGERSVLSLQVAGAQSQGRVTVLEGIVQSGGPPLHVHDAEDEVVIVLDGELEYQVGDERGALRRLLSQTSATT